MDIPNFSFQNFTTLGTALNIIASMITPALLISATGTLILSTSNRLARVIDRLRKLSDLVERLSDPAQAAQLRDERVSFWEQSIALQARRLHMLQRILTLLYLAVVAFISTSVSIGIAAIGFHYYWIPVAIGIAGALLLLASAVMLLVEVQLSVKGTQAETEFHLRLARHHASMGSGAPPAVPDPDQIPLP